MSGSKIEKNSCLSSEVVETILESITDGVFTIDHDLKITSFNRAAEEITGVSRQVALGKSCSSVFNSSMCKTGCAMKETLCSGKSIKNSSAFFIDVHGRKVPVAVSTALLKNNKGEVVGGVETFRDLTVLEDLRKELDGVVKVGDMVTKSPLMRKILDFLPQISRSTSPVLIYGATGTGKELLARAVHNLSLRRKSPFVAVNCGALPDTLLESELFGYKAGAFTGAGRDKPGRFAMAQGGTLFLDEIGEISPAFQVRLLRVLQEKEYEPLGGVSSVESDVRVICATNKNLVKEMQEGRFREDLFYRINVIPIELPELSLRREDIPLLIDHFIGRFNKIQKKSIEGIDHDALASLLAYDFPGNIRELENIIERAFVLCDESTITMRSLPGHQSNIFRLEKEKSNLHDFMKKMERGFILDAINSNSTKSLAASELGLHRATLFRKMKQYRIEQKQGPMKK